MKFPRIIQTLKYKHEDVDKNYKTGENSSYSKIIYLK